MPVETVQPVDPKGIYLRNLPIVGDVPLGKIILGISEISPDQGSLNGILEMMTILEKGPAAVGDAHRLKTGLDILSSGAQLLHVAEVADIFVPAGASFVNAKEGLFPKVVQSIKEYPGIHMMIVYRKEDRGEESERKDATQTDVSPEEMSQKNLDYRQVMKEEVIDKPNKPRRMAFFAPYGSRRTFERKEKLRKGLIELLQEELPILLVMSRFKLSTFRFRMYASPHVLKFAPGTPEEEIRTRLHEEFQKLNARAH